MAEQESNIGCVDMTYTRQQLVDLGYVSAEEMAEYFNNPRVVYFTITTRPDGRRVLQPSIQRKDGSILPDFWSADYAPGTTNKEMFK